MDSPLVPTATITLDKERTLRLDLNALSDFEAMTGKSIMRGGLNPEQMDLADIRAMLWACLVQEDESLSIRQVGRMLHAGNLSTIKDAMDVLLANAMPEAEEGSEPDPLAQTKPSATATGGTRSGQQRGSTSD